METVPAYDSIDGRRRAQLSPEMGRTKTVSLTAAQIIAMGTAAINIVPAPKATEAIVVDDITVELILGSVAFTGGGVVHFYYTGLTVELMAQTIAAATVQGAEATTLWNLKPVQTAGGSVVSAGLGIDITNATAAFAAGNGTAKLHIKYRIVTL